MLASKPIFFVIAGPNGAGKSTLSKSILKPYGITAFDWDAEFNKLWSKYFYDLSIQDGIRNNVNNNFIELLNNALYNNIHFSFETNFNSELVMTHVNKAKEKGFTTCLIYFVMDNVQNCIHRVNNRNLLGGHYVSPDTIQERFSQGLINLEKFKHQFDSIFIIDSSLEWDIRGLTISKEKVTLIIEHIHKNTLSKYTPEIIINMNQGLSM